MGVNSLPKTVTPVTRHRRDCDLNPDPSAPESITLTTRLPSHPFSGLPSFINVDINEICKLCAVFPFTGAFPNNEI